MPALRSPKGEARVAIPYSFAYVSGVFTPENVGHPPGAALRTRPGSPAVPAGKADTARAGSSQQRGGRNRRRLTDPVMPAGINRAHCFGVYAGTVFSVLFPASLSGVKPDLLPALFGLPPPVSVLCPLSTVRPPLSLLKLA